MITSNYQNWNETPRRKKNKKTLPPLQMLRLEISMGFW